MKSREESWQQRKQSPMVGAEYKRLLKSPGFVGKPFIEGLKILKPEIVLSAFVILVEGVSDLPSITRS